MTTYETTGMNGEMDMTTYVRGILGMGLLVALGACGSAQADGVDDAASSDAFVRVINVEVVDVKTETFVEEIRLTSVAMANQDVLLEAEETGVIRELYVDRGDRVTRGAWIAKIDDRLLQAQVNQARAAADLADQTWDRRKRLWEVDQVGSEIAYLESRFAAEQTAATLAGLEERLDRTVVKAPFTGVLDERHVDIGTSVGPGQTIGRLVNLNPIKVFAGVPERYASDVKVGATALMRFEALGQEVYTAPIRYVSSTINPSSRTFTIEVEVANRDGAIKPQMVANMSVTRQEVENAIVAPQDAMVRVEEGYVVFVAVQRGGNLIAEARAVELGPTRRNLVVIRAGLAAGEQLVVVGQKSVSDGDRVNIVGR